MIYGKAGWVFFFFFLRIGACSGLDVGENEIDESKE